MNWIIEIEIVYEPEIVDGNFDLSNHNDYIKTCMIKLKLDSKKRDSY